MDEALYKEVDRMKTNAAIAPQWYAVKEGDATMLPNVLMPGQKKKLH